MQDYDPDITCAACQEIGHGYAKCPVLEEFVHDPRDWQELAPSELLFPRWEIPIMSYMVAGITSSTGAVIGTAGMLDVVRNNILHLLHLVFHRTLYAFSAIDHLHLFGHVFYMNSAYMRELRE